MGWGRGEEMGGVCREISENFQENSGNFQEISENFPEITGMTGNFNMVFCSDKLKY